MMAAETCRSWLSAPDSFLTTPRNGMAPPARSPATPSAVDLPLEVRPSSSEGMVSMSGPSTSLSGRISAISCGHFALLGGRA